MKDFENIYYVKSSESPIKDDILKKGESAEYRFDLKDADLSYKHRLFFTGETKLYYLFKDEPDMANVYCQIEDALDNEHAHYSRYALNLSMKKNAEYIKRLNYEFAWPPVLSYLNSFPESDECTLGIYAEADNLSINKDEGGFLRYTAEVWYWTHGQPQSRTDRPADAKYTIDIPEGTYESKFISKQVEIPTQKSCYVLVTVEGKNYSGTVYLESPQLQYKYRKEMYNVIPPFNTSCHDENKFDWIGMNISRKEWPEFEITLNGQVIHCGETFERCHRYAEIELPIPPGILKKTDNVLNIKYISDYKDVLPYSLRELAIIEQPQGKLFEVIAIPEVADFSKDIPILIRTSRDNLTVKFECPSGLLSAPEYTAFEDAGLNVLKLRANKAQNHVEFYLSCLDEVKAYNINRIVIREDDNFLIGTGDQVYINQNYEDLESYLAWYVANGIGNLFTLRPVYRWAGSRTTDPKAWRRISKLLCDLGIKYVHMIDGRDLPGIPTNPSIKTIESENFLGRQLHERDGQFFYWYKNPNPSKTSQTRTKAALRLYLENPETVAEHYSPENYIYVNNKVLGNTVYAVDNDMKKTAESSVEGLKKMRQGLLRHTGPSMTAKYFYQAGFDFFGFESLYNSTEPAISFLRGAAKSYGKDTIGEHHAIQWSTSPHDTPGKYSRYRLALYTGYMHGIHHMNTEEGLWHMEEYYAYFHRFTEPCVQLTKNHQDFVKYVSAHTRRGKYYTPFAFVHGRYDGTIGFGHSIFGFHGFPEGEDEKSWADMFKIFYPLSSAGDVIYKNNCISERIGMFSGNPLGNVDTISLDAPCNVLNDYKTACFVSYNCAEQTDMDKLYDYIQNGGTVILSWPHLSVTTNRSDIDAHKFEIIDHKIVDALTDGRPEFEPDSVGIKNKIEACTNLSDKCRVLEKTDSGKPLAVEAPIGNGKMILVNAKAYPHNEAVIALYKDIVSNIANSYIENENCWIYCDSDVQYAVYKRDNGITDIYVLAIDWFNSPDTLRKFTLRVAEHSYDLTLPFGIMLKITVSDDTAVFSYDENVECDFTDDRNIEVMGEDTVEICVLRDGEIQKKSIDLGNEIKKQL